MKTSRMPYFSSFPIDRLLLPQAKRILSTVDIRVGREALQRPLQPDARRIAELKKDRLRSESSRRRFRGKPGHPALSEGDVRGARDLGRV